MKTRWLLLTNLALLLSSAALATNRRKADCAKVSPLEKLLPGWGRTAKNLQKLPSGAKLCGTSEMGTVSIASDLTGKAIEDFYTPLFAAAGCKPLTCKSNMGIQTDCTCPALDRWGKMQPSAGRVLTQTDDAAYQLYSPYSP